MLSSVERSGWPSTGDPAQVLQLPDDVPIVAWRVDPTRHIDELWLGERNVGCQLPRLVIRTKRAAGRPRDIEALAELEALRDERDAAV